MPDLVSARRITAALLLCLPVTCAAQAGFSGSDKRLEPLYKLEGYFVENSSDGEVFRAGAPCSDIFQDKKRYYLIRQLRPGFVEFVGLFGQQAAYKTDEVTRDRVPARYKVIRTNPLTFDLEIDTKSAFLVERFVYQPKGKTLVRTQGVECRYCIGGQKYAFDKLRNDPIHYTFCTGTP